MEAKLIAAIVIALFLSLGGFYVGKTMEEASWQKEKITMQNKSDEILKDAIDKRDSDILKYSRIAKEASEGYENEKDKNASLLATNSKSGGLRISRAICAEPSTSSKAASSIGINEGSSTTGVFPEQAGTDIQDTVELPKVTSDQLRALMKQADDLSAQIRALEDWISKNGFNGETK
jgi:hypothetical protein